MAPAHSTTITEFRTQVAAEITRIERERSASRSTLADTLMRARIPAEVTPGDSDEYKVTIKEDDTAGLPDGTKRSDFKSDALATMDAKFLASEKERVWQHFRHLVIRGSFTAAQAKSALENLGYTALPEPHTEVTFYTRNEVRRDSYGDPVYDSVNFTVPGEVSRDEIEAKLNEAIKPSSIVSVVKSAFENAGGLPSPIRDLYVSVRQTWPDHSEHYTEEV